MFFLVPALLGLLGVTTYYAIPKTDSRVIHGAYNVTVSRVKAFWDMFIRVPGQVTLEPSTNSEREPLFAEGFNNYTPEFLVGGSPKPRPESEKLPKSNWSFGDANPSAPYGAQVFPSRPTRDMEIQNLNNWMMLAQHQDICLEIGVFEGAFLINSNVRRVFASYIGIDALSSSSNSMAMNLAEAALTEKLRPGELVIKDEALYALIHVRNYLRFSERKLSFIFFDCESENANTSVATALSAFELLAEGGVFVFTAQSLPNLDEVNDDLDNCVDYLNVAATSLRLMAGRYELLPIYNDDKFRIAIRKREGLPLNRLGGRVFASPFVSMYPFDRSILKSTDQSHSFVNIHMVNFFGLGTRIDQCTKCKWKLEQEHNADWESRLLIAAPKTCGA